MYRTAVSCLAFRVFVTVTDGRGDTVVVDSTAPGRQGVNRYVWSLRYAGPTRLTFERATGAEEEENPFRNVGGPRVIPGTYTVTLNAAGRRLTRAVTVEPDPILGGDPARFAAQLSAGLAWRDAMSALNEMLNGIVSSSLVEDGERHRIAGVFVQLARVLDQLLDPLAAR